MAGRESFDLFMLDWQVPDVSGAEVLMWLRANVSKSVPVLFAAGTERGPGQQVLADRGERLAVRPGESRPQLMLDNRLEKRWQHVPHFLHRR